MKTIPTRWDFWTKGQKSTFVTFVYLILYTPPVWVSKIGRGGYRRFVTSTPFPCTNIFSACICVLIGADVHNGARSAPWRLLAWYNVNIAALISTQNIDTTATRTRKILEYNNSEKFARQTGSPLVFDASQKGNWENVRNECINGKPFRFNCDILEPPPSVSQQYATT